jgi:pimeloyl-ACP methyl ester carboxylesterase
LAQGDTVGSQRTAFFGGALDSRLALLFAAIYPERTRAVVTFAAHPASMLDEDYPWGFSQEEREQLLASLGMVPTTQPGCCSGWPARGGRSLRRISLRASWCSDRFPLWAYRRPESAVGAQRARVESVEPHLHPEC